MSIKYAVSGNGPVGVLLLPAKYTFSLFGPAILVGTIAIAADGKTNRKKRQNVLAFGLAGLSVFNWILINGGRVRARRGESAEDLEDKAFQHEEYSRTESNEENGLEGYLYILGNSAFAKNPAMAHEKMVQIQSAFEDLKAKMT